MILVSFIIPTLNTEKVLDDCLRSISIQTINNYEIIIADGGSTDNTLKIAKKYHCKIVPNHLKTGEAGKAAALKHARGKYIALIDSDNILPDPNWLSQMLSPLKTDPALIGSEPYSFTYRPHSGFIERYSALIGANDPYAFIFGVADRLSFLNGKFITLPLVIQEFPTYYQLKLEPNQPIPTIGANGTVFRSDFLKKYATGSYLFDIDIITHVLNSTAKPLSFAKIKNGIIHSYCESSIGKFIRKQKRRVCDHFSHRELRTFNWHSPISQHPGSAILNLARQNLYFVFYSTTIVLPLVDSVRGFARQPDPAWFFHPLACYITFIIYLYYTLLNIFKVNTVQNRQYWSQS